VCVEPFVLRNEWCVSFHTIGADFDFSYPAHVSLLSYTYSFPHLLLLTLARSILQAKYFQDRIKVNGKAGQLGDKFVITHEKTKVIILVQGDFSKRYIKYLSKKFLKKHQLKEFLRITAPTRTTFELKYYNVGNDEEETA